MIICKNNNNNNNSNNNNNNSNNNNNNKNKNCNDNNNEGNGTETAKVKAMGSNLTCSVSGVRGAQPDHCGWQHLPHRLLPGRTIHEVRRQ